MSIEITQAEFNRDAAEAVFRDRGFPFFVALDVPPVENTTHWHSFSSLFYITKGSVSLTDGETGTTYEAEPGSLVSVPAQALHAERSEEGYSILLGVSRDPATFEDPVNLPPEELPHYENGFR